METITKTFRSLIAPIHSQQHPRYSWYETGQRRQALHRISAVSDGSDIALDRKGPPQNQRHECWSSSRRWIYYARRSKTYTEVPETWRPSSLTRAANVKYTRPMRLAHWGRWFHFSVLLQMRCVSNQTRVRCAGICMFIRRRTTLIEKVGTYQLCGVTINLETGETVILASSQTEH